MIATLHPSRRIPKEIGNEYIGESGNEWSKINGLRARLVLYGSPRVLGRAP